MLTKMTRRIYRYPIALAAVVHILSNYLVNMGQDPVVAALARDYLIIMGYSLSR